MYNRLTRKELLIIEKTRREGEELAGENRTKKFRIKPLIWLLLVFAGFGAMAWMVVTLLS